MKEFLDYEGVQCIINELNTRIPPVTSNDNDKILSVVNGVPTWIEITNAEGVKY